MSLARIVSTLSLAVFVSGYLVACGDGTSSSNSSGSADDDHDHVYDASDALKPDCTAIKDACHEKDVGDKGEVHDCHEVAHEDDAAQCKKEKPRCVDLCKKAPKP